MEASWPLHGGAASPSEPQNKDVSIRRGLLARYPWITSIAAFVAGKAFPGILTLGSIPVWIHGFGAANYALFSLYWTGSLIGTSLTLGWLKQAILRQAGNESLAYEAMPGRTRILVEATPVSVVVPLGLLTWPMMANPADGWGFLAASCFGLLVNGRYVVHQTVVQRDTRATVYAVAETVRTAATLVFSVCLVAVHAATAWGLVAANTAGMALALGVLMMRDRRVGRSAARAIPGPQMLRTFWRFGWPLSLWLAVSSSTMYLDRFVLSRAHGLQQAGDYAAAADLVVRGMGMVVAPAIMFLHPAFMRAWNTGSRAEALGVWRRMTGLLTIGAIGCSVAVFLAYLGFAKALLVNPPSATTFGALVIGGAVWQLALMVHKPLEANDGTRAMLGALLVSLLVTLGVDLLLAPNLAALGVALGFLLGALCYVGLTSILNVRIIRSAETSEASQ
jgi:O-antigen/teichoic acid export membrane protein